MSKEVGTGPWSFAKYPENCYSAPVGERSIVMCMHACLSVRGSASVCLPSYTSRLRQVLLHVSYGRDSVLLRRRCDTLCSSGCTHDAMFACNGQILVK